MNAEMQPSTKLKFCSAWAAVFTGVNEKEKGVNGVKSHVFKPEHGLKQYRTAEQPQNLRVFTV